MAEVDVVVYYQRQVVFQLLVDQIQKSLAKSRVAREAGSSGFHVAIRCGCDAFLKKRLGKTNPLRHLLQVPVKNNLMLESGKCTSSKNEKNSRPKMLIPNKKLSKSIENVITKEKGKERGDLPFWL